MVETHFAGQVQLFVDDKPLGFVRVTLTAEQPLTEAGDGKSTWGGLIQGSDYLMWGGNHRRLDLRFPSGETVSVVVRATGRLLGFGPVPAALVSE